MVRTLEGKLMFNSVLRSLMQMYLANCITMWMTLARFKTVDSRDKVETLTAMFILFFAFAMPIWALTFLHKHRESVKEVAFKRKFDSLYQNVEYFNARALAYTSYFFGRRLFFAFVLVCCEP